MVNMKRQVKNRFSATRSTLHATRVFVGLSGGVDSSVSAVLLKEAGYDVTGVFIKVWTPPFFECTWKDDRLDAMRVCAKIGIPFITLDLEKEYKKEVVDYMIREYKTGRTPNPDVMCNKEVKFGAFYKWARKQGADFVATGHYARIVKREAYNAKRKSGKVKGPFHLLHATRYTLCVGSDPLKDQSYFLWNLKQEQLGHILFPVGHLEKPEVRKIAEEHDLVTATKKDSQGLCFIGKVDMKDFLKEFIPEKMGDVLDTTGKVIGKHDGAVFYTIGERHGFEILKKTSDDKPYYVVSKNFKKNTITVSQSPADTTTGFGAKTVHLKNISWTSTPLAVGTQIQVRLRYRQILISAKIMKVSKNFLEVNLGKPETTITPGQSLVMYKGEELVGGGVIFR